MNKRTLLNNVIYVGHFNVVLLRFGLLILKSHLKVACIGQVQFEGCMQKNPKIM